MESRSPATTSTSPHLPVLDHFLQLNRCEIANVAAKVFTLSVLLHMFVHVILGCAIFPTDFARNFQRQFFALQSILRSYHFASQKPLRLRSASSILEPKIYGNLVHFVYLEMHLFMLYQSFVYSASIWAIRAMVLFGVMTMTLRRCFGSVALLATRMEAILEQGTRVRTGKIVFLSGNGQNTSTGDHLVLLSAMITCSTCFIACLSSLSRRCVE